MPKIMYTRPDGGVSIVHPVAKEVIEKDLGRSLTNAEYNQFVRNRSIPANATNVTTIADNALPTDREFRNAWRNNNGQITIDLPAAKALKLAQCNARLNAKKEALQKAYNTAVLNNEDVTPLKAEFARLNRLLDGLIALNPSSVQEIKQAIPEELQNE